MTIFLVSKVNYRASTMLKHLEKHLQVRSVSLQHQSWQHMLLQLNLATDFFYLLGKTKTNWCHWTIQPFFFSYTFIFISLKSKTCFLLLFLTSYRCDSINCHQLSGEGVEHESKHGKGPTPTNGHQNNHFLHPSSQHYQQNFQQQFRRNSKTYFNYDDLLILQVILTMLVGIRFHR